MSSRIQKSYLNARVNFIFYFITLFLSFYSRKIFLNYLGADFIGLTGTLQNILSLLNIAELGISGAIGFNLYKPIQEKNKEKINELISLFGWFYRYVGSGIFILAFILSLFFPLIFAKATINLPIIYLAFYAFLVSSLIGYFVNYKSILLTADQKNYIVSSYLQTSNLIKTIVQIGICYYYQNYYLWILIELIFGIIGGIILNYKINKEYPWLITNIKKGSKYCKQYPQIIKSTRQVFVHKVKDFLLMQSDQILIFAFVSLKMVAYYGNYTLLISKIISLFDSILNSVSAGIGALVAEGNKTKIITVFWELMCIRYYIAGFVATMVYLFIEPLITLWLGKEYLLRHSILILLITNTYIILSRGVIDNFNYAYGHFADTWSAWTEGILNLGITLLLAPKFGVTGILLGKIASLVLIVIWWKPYYLFKSGFQKKILEYWKQVWKYHFIFLISFGFSLYIRPYIFTSITSWTLFMKYILIQFSLYFIIYSMLFYFFAPGAKLLKTRIYSFINHK